MNNPIRPPGINKIRQNKTVDPIQIYWYLNIRLGGYDEN